MSTAQQAPSSGSFLISNSVVSDSGFSRTVILLCSHDKNGSFGLILNQPLPITLNAAIPLELNWDAPMGRGGPVQADSLHFLYIGQDHGIGGQPVMDNVFWGGDFERANQLIASGEVDSDCFRFFAGYSGWSAGQLANEMKHEAWYVSQATPDFVMSPTASTLWKDVLASMGPEYQLISRVPSDPRLN